MSMITLRTVRYNHAKIIRPRVICNVRAFGARFHISASFTYVIPWTGDARNFIYNITLFFFGGVKLWYRKLLLERLKGFISDFDAMFFKTWVSGSVRPLIYGRVLVGRVPITKTILHSFKQTFLICLQFYAFLFFTFLLLIHIFSSFSFTLRRLQRR